MAGLSKRAWLGYAAEVPGTPPANNTVALLPTVFAPAKSEMKFMRANSDLDEDRGTRDEVYGKVYGIRHAELSTKSGFYYETCYYPILSAIGTDTPTTVVTGAYKHVATWADTPRTLTWFQSYDTSEYYSGNAMTDKFSIKVTGDGKLVDFDATAKGLFPIKQAVQDTPNFFTPGTSKPSAGYNPTIALSGGATSIDIMDFEFAFEQKLRLWTPIAGSPDFTHIYPGGRKATVSFTARFDNDTYFNKWLSVSNGTTDSLIFDCKGDLIVGSTYNELNISIPIIAFTDMELDKSKEDVVVKIKADVISGSTGLFALYVVNSLATYTV